VAQQALGVAAAGLDRAQEAGQLLARRGLVLFVGRGEMGVDAGQRDPGLAPRLAHQGGRLVRQRARTSHAAVDLDVELGRAPRLRGRGRDRRQIGRRGQGQGDVLRDQLSQPFAGRFARKTAGHQQQQRLAPAGLAHGEGLLRRGHRHPIRHGGDGVLALQPAVAVTVRLGHEAQLCRGLELAADHAQIGLQGGGRDFRDQIVVQRATACRRRLCCRWALRGPANSRHSYGRGRGRDRQEPAAAHWLFHDDIPSLQGRLPRSTRGRPTPRNRPPTIRS